MRHFVGRGRGYHTGGYVGVDVGLAGEGEIKAGIVIAAHHLGKEYGLGAGVLHSEEGNRASAPS